MFFSDTELDTIADYRPSRSPDKSLLKAAVAIIIRDVEWGSEFLLMQRAKHEHDPWSGQMSFPGGKIEATDESAKMAAIREVEEEVGLALTDVDYIGQINDVYGLKVDNQYSVHVSCFVFKPTNELSPVGNYEVADLVWLPISYLDNPNNAHDHRHPQDLTVKMPSVMIDADKEQILWGLSLRMLSEFYSLIGRPLRVLSEQDHSALQKIEQQNVDSSALTGKAKRMFEKRL
jgi:8-oxo-dGTP pyrophosphatase MutT (NUDIX family)